MSETTALGMKSVTKKTGESIPPRDVLDAGTKARRAWLATELARVNALPNTSGRIVGIGSYERVAIYTTTQKPGRVRHRGTCQFCGAEQVVDRGTLVHHGYSRPGWGSIYNDCPGVHCAPLNQSTERTERWLAAEIEALPRLQAHEQQAIVARDAARADRLATGENSYDAQHAKPYLRRNPTLNEQAAHVDKMAAWAAKFPRAAAKDAAEDKVRSATSSRQCCESRITHFRALLASGVYGTPLTVEVVA